MENHVVLDFQLSASSSKYSSRSSADRGRLNLNYTFNANTSTIENYGGWIAADNDNEPWMLVDFISNVTVSGIATQGEDEGMAWVTSFELSYGQSKYISNDYQEDDIVKVISRSHGKNNACTVKGYLFLEEKV